jgi:hypothetical protein
VFMTQVAAMSWAETQQPETTLASQSLLKTGFLSASQIEFGFLMIEFGFVLIGWVPTTRGVSLNSIDSLLDRKRDFFWRMLTKAGVKGRGSTGQWSAGVLEYWSTGVLEY